MGMLDISQTDKKLVEHLQLGGRVDDDIALQYVGTMVSNTLANPRAGESARSYGLGEPELIAIYVAATRAIMPEPLIWHGGPIIATSLFFLDFDSFPDFINIITERGTLNSARDLALIEKNAASTVTGLRETATARGRARPLNRAYTDDSYRKWLAASRLEDGQVARDKWAFDLRTAQARASKIGRVGLIVVAILLIALYCIWVAKR